MDSNQSIIERLEQLEESVQESNKILRSMRRSQRIARAFSILYWVIVIGIAVGAFVVIRPYVDSINNTVEGIQNLQDQVVDRFSGQ